MKKRLASEARLEKVSGIDPVTHAACNTLDSRLRDVERYLELAANHADESDEHVHQLRVATRRARTALTMYQGVLPKKQARWFRRNLHRIRKAASDARDLDVFIRRYTKRQALKEKGLAKQITRRRRKAQRPLLALHKKMGSRHQFERRIQKLLSGTIRRASDSDRSLKRWAKARVAKTANDFFEAAPATPAPSPNELHRFRVRGKDLRYALELFSDVMPAKMRKSIYRDATQLQERLGQVCDHDNACQRLEAWSEETTSIRESVRLRKLAAKEHKALDASMAEFASWWTPARSGRMRRKLSEITHLKSHPVGRHP